MHACSQKLSSKTYTYDVMPGRRLAAVAVCRDWRQLSRPGLLWAAIALTDWKEASSADGAGGMTRTGRNTVRINTLQSWFRHHAPLLQQLQCNRTNAWTQARLRDFLLLGQSHRFVACSCSDV